LVSELRCATVVSGIAWQIGGKKEKERKQAEHQEPQGFKSKTLIVENFFGLQE